MLVLKNIVKEYETAGEPVAALKGVTVAFRKREFVSILGHSGCGKTTLLNVVGGLDRYTSGDLVIRGVSTEEYKERDWDTYRNHSVGFVFQSYNLIPHQTVLSNVELALTLSGVSKAERRQRAIDVLTKVGLGDQIHKKPNQMSGGQMQRVAIARALINDPEILLADEPTGALDTDTSVQIMELLKEISGDRLIIMVTHNPEIAEQYSDRIIRLKDGLIVGDTNPFSIEDEARELQEIEATDSAEHEVSKGKKTSMSFLTALSLSLNNLMTKKGRTFMTAFAGSIGIIGIALILSLSNGVKNYIDKVQKDTLSSYPIQIESETMDIAGLMNSLMGGEEEKANREDGKIYSSTVLYDMMNAMNTDAIKKNDLEKFKLYLDSEGCKIWDYASHIQYGYNVSVNAYMKQEGDNYFKADISTLFSSMSGEYGSSNSYMDMSQSFAAYSVWQQMLDDYEHDQLINPIIKSQYDLLDGKWPESANEIVLLVSQNNEVSDVTLYSLGLVSSEQIIETIVSAMKGSEEQEYESYVYDYSDIIGTKYKVIATTDNFVKDKDGNWKDISGTRDAQFKEVIASGIDVEIVGVIRQKPDATSAALSGSLIYTRALTDELMKKISESDIVKEQKANENIDVFTGLPFVFPEENKTEDALKPEAFLTYVEGLSDERKAELFKTIITTPKEEIVEKAAKEMLESYGITEETAVEQMKEAIVGFAGKTEEEKAFIEAYVGRLDREALYEFVLATCKDMVRTQLSNDAMGIINAVLNIPDSNEIIPEKAVIAYSLLPKDGPASKRGVFRNLQMVFGADEQYQAMATILDGIIAGFEEAEDEELIKNFEKLLDIAGGSAPFVNMIYSMVDMFLDMSAKRAFIIGEYLKNTNMPDNVITAYLDGLTVDELKVHYNAVLEKAAIARYAAVSAATQPESTKNKKLAAALTKHLGENSNELAYYYDEYVDLEAPTSLKDNYITMGFADERVPTSITIYVNDFEGKEKISELIAEYNENCENEEAKINYTDYVALLMSSVTTIVDAISAVLIAFVSISLIVSSIMIGIITYISVLERTKEIGVLRSIGASRKDISRVFNAETLIVGFVAGAIGIIVTLLINIPICIVVKTLFDINGIASLPVVGGIALVLISMFLTVIAGLMPSGVAAKKDPVVALRSE